MVRNLIVGALMAAALSVSAPSIAAAEGWLTHDFGNTRGREDCLRRAENALYAYRDRFGGGEILASRPFISLYNFDRSGADLIIYCPIVSGVVKGFLIVSGGDTQNRRRVRDRLDRLW